MVHGYPKYGNRLAVKRLCSDGPRSRAGVLICSVQIDSTRFLSAMFNVQKKKQKKKQPTLLRDLAAQRRFIYSLIFGLPLDPIRPFIGLPRIQNPVGHASVWGDFEWQIGTACAPATVGLPSFLGRPTQYLNFGVGC